MGVSSTKMDVSRKYLWSSRYQNSVGSLVKIIRYLRQVYKGACQKIGRLSKNYQTY